MRYIHDIKCGTSQVYEHDISLREWSGGTAHLRGNIVHDCRDAFSLSLSWILPICENYKSFLEQL